MSIGTERSTGKDRGDNLKCKNRKRDCFALRPGGECDCLSDTSFADGCKFYKPDTTDYAQKITLEEYPGRYWVRVKGYAQSYMVSSWGEVKNSKHHMLVRSYSKSGRPYVNLLTDTHPTRYYVADLVAEAFVPGVGDVVHKDGDLDNCRASNLVRQKGRT